MNYGQEFQSYYTKHLGKPSSHLDYFAQQIESSMTPYILEEREMRVTQMDIFLSFNERPFVMGCGTSK
jgi:ATP-dependent Clp protease, protease subunit